MPYATDSCYYRGISYLKLDSGEIQNLRPGWIYSQVQPMLSSKNSHVWELFLRELCPLMLTMKSIVDRIIEDYVISAKQKPAIRDYMQPVNSVNSYPVLRSSAIAQAIDQLLSLRV